MKREAQRQRHEQIRKTAAYLNLSHAQLAQIFGLSVSMISKILNEKPEKEDRS